MGEQTELKYCPFCEFTKQDFAHHTTAMELIKVKWDGYKPIIRMDDVLRQYVVICQNCGIVVVINERMEEDAIAVWNGVYRQEASDGKE